MSTRFAAIASALTFALGAVMILAGALMAWGH